MIRLVEDVGAPAAVTAIDMLTLEMAPAYNEMADYIMTGAGYLGGFFLKGTVGNFLASMGAASLPLTARAIRERVKSPVARSVGASRMAFRSSGRVQSYPAQPKNTADNWPRAV
jgi:hypothetical protein